MSISVEYLVVAGGGGGGGGLYHGGGGGAGGYRSSVTGESSGGGTSAETPLLAQANTSYTITVGAGGNGVPGTSGGSSGNNSVFGSITSIGGGLGGTYGATPPQLGGSGGGADYTNSPAAGTAGQGYAGGNGALVAPNYGSGGGGGAGAVGGNGTGTTGGAGGTGVSSSITGSAVTRAGGGGGSTYNGGTTGAGGAGGGGGGSTGSTQAGSGTPNTGGGGGGAERAASFTTGGAGGSGVVILKYPNTSTISNTGGGLTFTTATVGGFNITTFTAGTGSIQFSGPGLAASSNDLTSGETLVITLRTEDTADNTTIAYTITGVDSGDINGSALSGNFTMVDNTASVSFLITTTAKKTLTFQSNGFTETVALIENRFGLSVLTEPASITLTSANLSVIDLSASDFLTNIVILANTNQFVVSTEPIIAHSSANFNNIIDLTVGINSLYNISILQPNEAAKFNLAASPSVLLALRVFITIDFASRTAFNNPDVIDFDPPQFWVGA